MNLVDSKVHSSDFQALEASPASLTSAASAASATSLASTAQFPQKNYLILMVLSSLAPKLPILVPFCGLDHQKFNFSLIFLC